MKVHLTAPPWTLGRREGPPLGRYHHTLDFRRQGRWGRRDYGTFQLQVSGRGGGGPESEVPMRVSSSALVRPSVTHGGTLRARRRPANGRRRSPAIIRTGSAQGTFQRSTLPPHLGPSAGEKVPPYPHCQWHTLDFRRHWQGRWGGGDYGALRPIGMGRVFACLSELKGLFFLESTFIDQINPKRQTAGPHEGGLTGTGPRVVRLSPTLRMSH